MIPLQFPGLLGGPEVLVGLVVLAVVYAFVGRWVYRDAKKQGSKWAWQWGVGTAVLLFFGFVPGVIALLAYFLLVR